MQNEIQSAHWHHEQVTIFTAYVWFGSKKGIGYSFVSDEMNRGKVAVYAFIDALILDLLASFPQMESVLFFSDGAASKFKQRYLFTNLTFMLDQYNITATWSFFATSHGKGAVDGIGGTVKRLVWNNILAGRVVSTAKDFADVATENIKNINVVFISAEEISKFSNDLSERWNNIYPLPDTQSIHYLKPVSRCNVEYHEYFYSRKRMTFNLKENLQTIINDSADKDAKQLEVKSGALTVGDFLLIEWHGKKSKMNYIGQVLLVEDEGIEISCLRKHNNEEKIFAFPEKEDKCWIDYNQIIQKLLNPEILTDGSNTRLRCRFKLANVIQAE